MHLSSHTFWNLGSWNILHPLFAVLDHDIPGLNLKAQALLQENHKLKSLLNQGLDWKMCSNWETRYHKIAETLLQAQTSIICVQENSAEMTRDLNEKFTGTPLSLAIAGYHSIPSEEDMDSQYGTAIYYDRDQVDLIDSGVIRYQELHENGTLRASAYALFKDCSTQKTIRIASAHLRGYWIENPDAVEREEKKIPGFRALHHLISELSEMEPEADATAICGDLNEAENDPESPLYRLGLFATNGYIEDGNRTPSRPVCGLKLDWIFVKSTKGDLALHSIEQTHTEHSDHALIRTRVEFRPDKPETYA